MKRNPTLLEGLLIALLAGLLVTGAILLAGYENLGLSGTKALPTVEIAEAPQNLTVELPVAVTGTQFEQPTATICPPPEGWDPYEVKTGDSLGLLAGERLIELNVVMEANCLSRPGALPGTIIYLPPLPPTLTPTITSTPTITFTPTITLRACEFPQGWVRYSLKPGDTLFKLGVLFKTSEVEIITSNCLSFGTALHAGDILMVPSIATATPSPR
jgi:hypothetical protein